MASTFLQSAVDAAITMLRSMAAAIVMQWESWQYCLLFPREVQNTRTLVLWWDQLFQWKDRWVSALTKGLWQPSPLWVYLQQIRRGNPISIPTDHHSRYSLLITSGSYTVWWWTAFSLSGEPSLGMANRKYSMHYSRRAQRKHSRGDDLLLS